MHPRISICRRMIFRHCILVTIACVIHSVASAEPFAFEYEGADVLPSVTIDGERAIIHTQGLYVTDKHFLVTGRLETESTRAVLLRFSRDASPTYGFIDITPQPIEGVTLDHPGGFDVDDRGRLWIPLSTSNPKGPSRICRYQLDADEPLTPREPEFTFDVVDHIGAVCCLNDDTLVGANWDTRRVYTWSVAGAVLNVTDQARLFPTDPGWQIAVQDWKHFNTDRRQLVILGGLDKSNEESPATIQLIDLANRTIVASHQFSNRDDVSRPITNEGCAVHAGKVFLLPEDIGRGAKVLRYRIVQNSQ